MVTTGLVGCCGQTEEGSEVASSEASAETTGEEDLYTTAGELPIAKKIM